MNLWETADPGAYILGQCAQQPFISHVTLAKLLNLSGPHFCICQWKYLSDKEPVAHSSLWQTIEEETNWRTLVCHHPHDRN